MYLVQDKSQGWLQTHKAMQVLGSLSGCMRVVGGTVVSNRSYLFLLEDYVFLLCDPVTCRDPCGTSAASLPDDSRPFLVTCFRKTH